MIKHHVATDVVFNTDVIIKKNTFLVYFNLLVTRVLICHICAKALYPFTILNMLCTGAWAHFETLI